MLRDCPGGGWGKWFRVAAKFVFYSLHRARKYELEPMIGGGRVENEMFFKAEELESLSCESDRKKNKTIKNSRWMTKMLFPM